MTIAVRVDGSARIGMGHVMRTLALARRLRAQGADVRFVMREIERRALQLVRDDGFTVDALPGDDVDPTCHLWLGVPLERDAEETAAALARIGPCAWLIADNYAIDERWERPLRAHAHAIFAFDDLADRRHDVDALLDQNVLDAASARYRDLVPARARIFLGPRYAQLRDAFATRAAHPRPRDGSIRTVLVAFGSDTGDHTRLAVDALAQCAPGLDVTVVLPDEIPAAAAIDAVLARHAWRRVPYVDDMDARLDAADLAIGAGGTSAWERAILGVPAIAWAIAENQRTVIDGLTAAGAIQPVRELAPAALAAAIEALRADRPRVRAIGAAAAAIMRDREHAIGELDALLLQRPAPAAS